MAVDFAQKDYLTSLPVVELCRDCVSGSQAVKSKGTKYLPKLDPTDNSPENVARYEQMKDLALFTNFTGRTVESLNGSLWRKEADIELPLPIEYMLDDCDGKGLDLSQFAKDVTFDLQQSARYGILVEYDNNNAQAKFLPYVHESIINVRIDNGKYSLVVLKQKYVVEDDGFEQELDDEYLVLKLIDGVYVQQIYRDNVLFAEVTPLDYNGNTFDEILFVFIGAKNNDETIDTPPIYPLAEVNIAHYRNSSSVERSGWIMGEPMLVIAPGENLPDDHFTKNPIRYGSTTGINVGAGGSADILQASPNTLAQELQKEKVEQMLLIGARLVTNQTTAETATGATIRYASENSILSTIATNTSKGIKKALGFAELFMAETPSDDITFEIGTEFFAMAPDAQLLNVLLMIADRGKYMPQDDFIKLIKKYGLIDGDRTLEEIKNELSQEDPLL